MPKVPVRKKQTKKRPKIPVPSQRMIDRFYASWSWKRLRYEVLKKHGAKCQCCGKGPQQGAVIHVDHIKPIRKHWTLRLVKSNLQVLCLDCNMGKGSHDTTDWRKK